MPAASNVTPLIALDAVAIDSETTGLDPAKARIVEIAAVRLVRGRLDKEAKLDRRVRPDEPIPPSATAIHGIDDAAVATAPDFAQVWAEFSAFVGDAVVIGHTIGFDLAVIKRECERAGIAWTRPRTLDTRLLAEVARPDLAGYSLENLAAWLGVEIVQRHSALGDAIAAAAIFRALVPKLRERGIRTLAEATQACRALTDVLDQQHRAGWVEPVQPPARLDDERTLARIDTYPYRHRVGEVMSAPAKFIAPSLPISAALDRMTREKISSLFVAPERGDEPPQAAQAGIITERDVLRALSTHGAAALDIPVEQVISRPLVVVPAEAFVYLAIARMSRLKIRHLGVVDQRGQVIGALSARDLLRLRAGDAVSLGDEIEHAADVHDLGRAWARLPRVAASLIIEEVAGRDIAAVISRRIGSLTRRAAILAEQRMAEAGQGAPPCPYALAVLGSAGRGESLLAMDQDNAIVFAAGEPDGPEDRWFAALGAHVADILHDVGVPYCPGGVMARNSAWRGSLATWRERINGWIRHSRPADLLSVDIFFDLRAVHGEAEFADIIWLEGFEAARGEVGFAKLLAETAGPVEPGLRMLGGFRTSKGRIDLKKAGLFGIVSMARVLAIRHQVIERATPARLAGVKALGLGGKRDLEALADAQGVFLDLILDQQIDDVEHGIRASNAVAVKRLDRHDADRLRGALGAVGHLDELTRDLLFRG